MSGCLLNNNEKLFNIILRYGSPGSISASGLVMAVYSMRNIAVEIAGIKTGGSPHP